MLSCSRLAAHLAWLAIIMICLGSPCAADEASAPANRDVRAGIFNFAGYHMKDDDGTLSGYGIDLLGLLSEYSNLNFIVTGYDKSWQDMLNMLRNGEIDIVTSARRTPSRQQEFIYSLPVGRNHTQLTVPLYNSRLNSGEYATYDGMIVGGVAGSSQNAHLAEYAREKGFTYTFREYEDPDEMARALQNGEIDAILSSNLRKAENEKVLDIIKSEKFYAIARKEDKALIDEINYAIGQMDINEGDWQNAIYYRYYGPQRPRKQDHTIREQKYISEVTSGKKKITATARPDSRPYSYIEDGTLKGILPDYFARVMEAAGLPYDLVAPRSTNDYRAMAEQNRVDVVLDRVSPQALNENAPYRGFTTDPYMITGVARVTKTDFHGPVKTVALPAKSPLPQGSSLLEEVEVKTYASPDDAMRAVQRGEADAAYILPYTAQLFVNQDPENNLYYTMVHQNGASFRMYVPDSSDHELITILNKAIKTIPHGTLNKLSSRYIAFNAGEMSVMQYLRANPQTMAAGIIGAALVCSLIFMMWLRGRWNRRLLLATEKANDQLAAQLAIVEALSRNYDNVFAINADRATTSIVKIEGYDPWAKVDRTASEKPYPPLLERYIQLKVLPEDREYAAKALDLKTICQELTEKDEYTGTYRVEENGETHHLEFTFVRLPEKAAGGDNLILAAYRNVDELIRREQEQQKTLSEALAQARYASAAKTAFLNNMSHDIRTPMNAIIGFTTLATSNVTNIPMVQRYLGKIMTSGNHLLSLINDVLDMSRIESGKVVIEEKENSLPAILHDLRTIAQADVKAKQLVFQIDTLNVVNETIFCDRLRLNQVLLNILNNAMKYTRPGGRVSVRVIQTEGPADGAATFEFRVRDSGIGMSEEFLKHVFEPFEREKTSTVSGIQGTGLGLAITKNIVDMMGGSISVESEPGKGSEFTVTFRFRVTEDRAPVEELPRFAGVRALVVDDDVNTCMSLSKMLSQLGLRPDWTTLGKEALMRTQFASEQKDAYGAYFIDWVMADMNGIELVRRLRKTVPPEVPIIIITAYDWTDAEEEAREAGVTVFCSKPIFLSELRKVLDQPDTQEKDGGTAQPQALSFAGRRLLLAEDNEMNQEIAQMILEDAGFELDIVEDGQLAVERMAEMPAGTYDLILMDVQMPRMNGYEATRAIRGLDDAAKAGIPIIAMTANAFDEDREEALSAGMNGYVAKPINIKKLMETLEEFLNGKADQAKPLD